MHILVLRHLDLNAEYQFVSLEFVCSIQHSAGMCIFLVI
jgi:hypothetical protein